MSSAALAYLLKFLPFLNWAKQTTAASARQDAVAGLTGAIIVLPQGVAYALIAGLPPEYGLYAAIVPAIVAAFLALLGTLFLAQQLLFLLLFYHHQSIGPGGFSRLYKPCAHLNPHGWPISAHAISGSYGVVG